MATKKKAASKKAAPKKKASKPVRKSAGRTAMTATSSLSSSTAEYFGRMKHTVYIEASAFHPGNSSDGCVDHFQAGRHTAIANRPLFTPIILPVGAQVLSMTIHYTNSTGMTPIVFFLRKHADRHCPSGEIEMSFINIPPGILPPDNFLSVTDTSFPDSGFIKDRYLHYLEVSGTGDYGREGRITIRGVSMTYVY